jgi:hypothetical protein
MILFLTTMMAMAAPEPPDALVTHLNSRSYRLNGKMLVVSKDKVLLGKVEGLQLQTETLPKMGNLEKEVARLQNKYGVTCVINIEPAVTPTAETSTSEPPTDIVQQTISGVTITDLGTCTIDSSVRYSIKDNGSLWTVVDNQGTPVSVQAFANMCEDIPLLLKLDLEEQVANRNGKVLQWGATAFGVGGVFTMGNPDPGFSAREQNKFWTGVFLFGSATILYTQRDIPFVYKEKRQTILSNYHTREEVDRILLKTFGLEDAPNTLDVEADVLDAQSVEGEKQTETNGIKVENINEKQGEKEGENNDRPSTEDDTTDQPSEVKP